MKVRHTLICFCFLSLQAGNTGNRVRTGTEGGSITFACSFMSTSNRRFLCKQECEEDILIETTSDSAENGRYRVEYTKTFFLSYPVLYVTISKLKKSDSGRYRCGLGTPLSPESHEDIDIFVGDDLATLKPKAAVQTFSISASTPTTTQSLSSISGSFSPSSASHKTTELSGRQQTEGTTAPLGSAPVTSKPNRTLHPLSTSVQSAPPAPTTTSQSLSSSSGSFSSSSASPKTTRLSEQQQTERRTAPLGSGETLLYVVLTLVFVVLLLSLVVLVFCGRRARNPRGHPGETEYTSVSQTNRAEEHIRGDKQSRSRPLEMSSFCTDGKYTETSDDSSFIEPNCATASRSQQAENDLSKPTASRVRSPSSTSALLHSAPAGSSNDGASSVS